MAASTQQNGNVPQVRVESYTQPRADGSIYRFHSETITTPSTIDGVHRIEDRQTVREVISFHDIDHIQTKERRVMIEQTISTARVRFEIRHAQEEQAHMRETQSLFEHSWDFEYDLYDAMSNISGWHDARPAVQRNTPLSLTHMPTPIAAPAPRKPQREAPIEIIDEDVVVDEGLSARRQRATAGTASATPTRRPRLATPRSRPAEVIDVDAVQNSPPPRRSNQRARRMPFMEEDYSP